MKYQFKTTATMKPYNNKKWWIGSAVIREITIEAATLKEALQLYRERVKEQCINISDSALRNKSPMYIDRENAEPIQTGYVITATTDFENHYKWTKQYIDLWITISVISNPFEKVIK